MLPPQAVPRQGAAPARQPKIQENADCQQGKQEKHEVTLTTRALFGNKNAGLRRARLDDAFEPAYRTTFAC